MIAPDTPLAVTFDFGQTLVDLDMEMLSRRLAERRVEAAGERLAQGAAAAWAAYNASILSGLGGHPWKVFMRRLLAEGGAPEPELDALTDWLWTEQPGKNLWRRPIPGVIAIVDDLRRADVRVGIVSNSEGRLAELVAELGWSDRFAALADSGRLGMEKPGREIFDWTAERLGVAPGRIVHVGDSFAADVQGALGAGFRALWFGGDRGRAADARVKVCLDATEVRAALADWGIALPA